MQLCNILTRQQFIGKYVTQRALELLHHEHEEASPAAPEPKKVNKYRHLLDCEWRIKDYFLDFISYLLFFRSIF